MTYDHWKTTNPADAELGNAEPRPTIVERYQGFDIYRDETGFGWDQADGCETIAEVRADIDAQWDRWEGYAGKRKVVS